MTKTEGSGPHILLVNPWIHDFAAYDFWAKPLGLLTLGGILRRHSCRVSYVDCLDRFHPRSPAGSPAARDGRGPFRKSPLTKPALFKDVPRRFSRYGIDPAWLREDMARLDPPDLVLVTSVMTYWYTGVRETIDVIRRVFPQAPVILGGVYATLCAEHAAGAVGAEEVVAGAAEERILALVETHTGYTAARRFDAENLDTYPLPAFDLQRRIPYVPLLTSRGCPFACAYCAAHFLEPRRLFRSPASIVAEVRHWHAGWGVRDFALYDDAFLADGGSHAKPLLEALVREALPIRFHTPNALHIRGIDAETATLLKRAGFGTLRLGLETTEFAERRGLDHKVTEAEFIRAAAALRKAGFEPGRIGAYLLVGLPEQEEAAVMRSIETAKRAGVSPIPAFYSPIPHTALWDKAVSCSRYDLAAEPLAANNAVFPCRREPFDWEWLSRLKQALR
jgi:radical SAM superfamily enzyme YgiQ (UPF0313 family)